MGRKYSTVENRHGAGKGMRDMKGPANKFCYTKLEENSFTSIAIQSFFQKNYRFEMMMT